jgi:hypothetical protein
VPTFADQAETEISDAEFGWRFLSLSLLELKEDRRQDILKGTVQYLSSTTQEASAGHAGERSGRLVRIR